jgi:hypothetical protein
MVGLVIGIVMLPHNLSHAVAYVIHLHWLIFPWREVHNQFSLFGVRAVKWRVLYRSLVLVNIVRGELLNSLPDIAMRPHLPTVAHRQSVFRQSFKLRDFPVGLIKYNLSRF